MANTLDLVINLVVRNQEAVRSIAELLDRLSKSKVPSIRPDGVERTRDSVAEVVGKVTAASFAFNQVTQSIQTMASAARPAYEYLIGANEKLNQQLLQSAATITATSAVSGANGQQLANIDAIRSLQPKLKSTIKEVEIATQSLVGVTSQQTSEVFNVILTNTGQLNGQLKSATTSAQKFVDPLDAAAKLAPGMVATLGTLGLPIAQAADEVGNLLKGEIDSTAQVAKSLGITREMVESWKAQGVLVDKLTQKFDPFLKANAEASRSVGGITSNIQDMIEIMGREAGKPLTEGFITALEVIYKTLQEILPQVQVVFTQIIAQATTMAGAVAQNLAPIATGIGNLIAAIGPSIGPLLSKVISTIGDLFSTLSPLFEIVGQNISSIAVLVGALLPVFIDLGKTISSIFITVLGGLVGVLVPIFKAISDASKVVVDTIASISADPIGKLVIQAALLVAVLAPIATTVIGLVSAFAALAGTAGGMSALGAIIVGFIPGIATAVTAVTGFGSAMSIVAAQFLPLLSAGFAGLAASASAAWVALSPLIVAAGPLIAIAGAVAVTLVAKSAKDLADVNQELEDLTSTNNAIFDNALKTAQKLKSLSSAAEKGGLSSAQKEEQKQAIFAGKQQIALIDEQIAANKKLREDSQKRGANQEQLNTFDQELKSLEKSRDLLSKYSEAVKIASQPLADLGTTSSQMAAKVKAASGVIAAGVGDPQKYAAAAKELTGLLQKQVEIGQITADEAAKQLAGLKNNSKLDYEAQLAAKEAIVKVYKDRFSKIQELLSQGQITVSSSTAELEAIKNNSDLEVKVRQEAAQKITEIRKTVMEADLAEFDARKAIIEAQKADGSIGEAEAAKQITAIKIKESQTRIAQQKVELDNELNPEKRRKLKAEIQKSEAEITKIKAEEIDRRNKERLKDFEEQSTVLKGEFDKGNVSQKSFNAQQKAIDLAKSAEEISQLKDKLSKLKSTDKEGREAIEAQIAAAESKREAALKAAQERELKLIDQQLKKTIDISKNAEIAKNIAIEEAVIRGKKSRVDADNEVAQNAIEAAEKQLEAELEKFDKLKALPPLNNPEDNEAQQQKLREQENKTAELRLALIKKVADAEKNRRDKEVEEYDKKVKDILEKDKNAELARNIIIEEAVLRGKKTREQADKEISASALAAGELQLNLERQKLQFLKDRPKSDNAEINEAEQRKIQEQEGKTLELQLSLIKRRADAEKAAAAERIKAIDAETKAIELQGNKRIDALDKEKKLLEDKAKFIDAGQRIESAAFGLSKQRLQNELESAKANKDTASVARIEAQLNSENIAFIQQQNAAKIESIKLAQEQRAIDLAIQTIQASIATIQSQANLQKAIAEGKTGVELEALKRESALRSQQETLLKQAGANQEKLNKRELGAAQLENQASLEGATKRGGRGSFVAGQATREIDAQIAAPGEASVKAAKAVDEFTASLIKGKEKIDPKTGEPIVPPLPAKPVTPTSPASPVTPPVAPVAPNSTAPALFESLGKKAGDAGNAIDNFSKKLNAFTPLKARLRGGPVSAGESFAAVEDGRPEIAAYRDGSMELLMVPGIYNLSRSAQIIPGGETQRRLERSTIATHSTKTIVMDNGPIINELKALRSIVQSRNPAISMPVTFTGPTANGADREVAKLGRMLLRSNLF